VQEPSVTTTVRDWLAGHSYTDLALQVAATAFFLLVALASVAGSLYWLWWLVRLAKRENVQAFTHKPIPGLRKGKAAGMEFEFGEVARAESEALRLMGLTVEELSFRLAGAEAAVKKLEGVLERFEDVSGRA
jgi:hypothetical protein